MLSNSTTASAVLRLQLVTQYMTITLGFILLIGGIIGNLLNIVVIFMLNNWKHNACSLYILVKSVPDLAVLFVGLLTLIPTYGFQFDFTSKNRVWYKLRIPLLSICLLGSLTCICLQSIDVFFCTSKFVVMRQKSNVRTARNLLIGFLLVCTAHAIPYYFVQDLIDVEGTFVRVGTNLIYNQYYSYFVYIGLYVVIPLTMITIFGCLTYRNLQMLNLHERRSLSALSRQMTRIALFHIVAVLLFQGPLGIIQVYFLVTISLAKDVYCQTQEQVARAFVYTFLYGTFASSFYCYCVASKRYREQALDVLKQLLSIRGRNQVLPLNQTIRGPTQHTSHT